MNQDQMDWDRLPGGLLSSERRLIRPRREILNATREEGAGKASRKDRQSRKLQNLRHDSSPRGRLCLFENMLDMFFHGMLTDIQ